MELSIVLVILGLLVGGVLSGQSLIHAAELRAVTEEEQRYTIAVKSFRDKYFGLPGDITNATTFWGRVLLIGGCPGAATTVTANGTCDGNGDGKLFIPGSGGFPAEFSEFWKQLNLAGLLEGSYSGYTASGGGNSCVIGKDCPQSKLANAGWTACSAASMGNVCTSIQVANMYTVDYGFYYYELGAAVSSAPWGTDGPVLKPEDAWNIDTKMDDGKPATGKIIARYWNNLCSAADSGMSSTTNLAASYRVSDNTVQCALYFLQ